MAREWSFIGKKYRYLCLFLLFCLIGRILLGVQINFAHEDYTQIYLIGLENAYSGRWSFWGPDVVWSQTRLPGALQGLLVGIPLRLTNSMYAPIIASNILSFIGLVLLSGYAKIRFPRLSAYFLCSLFMLLPFTLFNGVVLLNTAYLVLTGALLFIAVFELFVYRNRMLLSSGTYFFIMGFALLFTFQLHLTWVLFLPFLLVLFYFEWTQHRTTLARCALYFVGGAFVAALSVFPTLFKYGHVMTTNTNAVLNFQWNKFASIVDLFIRYLGIATFDMTEKKQVIALSMAQSKFHSMAVWAIKLYSILQFVVIVLSWFFIKKSIEFKKSALLFALTLLMAICLYAISNKHLEMRTYILLYPFPVWLSLYTYDYCLQHYKVSRYLLSTSLLSLFIVVLLIGTSNYRAICSFEAVKNKLQTAIDKKDPYEFANRRHTLMDAYQ